MPQANGSIYIGLNTERSVANQKNNTESFSETGNDSDSYSGKDNDAFMNYIENAEERSYRVIEPEYLKTLLLLTFGVFSWFCTCAALAVVNERTPNTKPLPDVIHDLIPYSKWSYFISEIIIIVEIFLCTNLVIFHRYRFVIVRRVLLLISILYLSRCICFLVTTLPKPDKDFYCEKLGNNASVAGYLSRTFQHMSSVGFVISGNVELCGDYIYSGHASILFLTYLLTYEYSPGKFRFIFSLFIGILSFFGILTVIISRSHYTIDVILAYFVTTCVFRIYHTLARIKHLENANSSLRYMWWYKIFIYFEKNVPEDFRNSFEIPNLRSLGLVS